MIVRFYTVPRVRDARISAGWALFFIAILYTTAPAVAAFARTNLIESVSEATYAETEGEKSIPQHNQGRPATYLLHVWHQDCVQ